MFDAPKSKSDISIEIEAKLFCYNCSLKYEEICHPKLIDLKIISGPKSVWLNGQSVGWPAD